MDEHFPIKKCMIFIVSGKKLIRGNLFGNKVVRKKMTPGKRLFGESGFGKVVSGKIVFGTMIIRENGHSGIILFEKLVRENYLEYVTFTSFNLKWPFFTMYLGERMRKSSGT